MRRLASLLTVLVAVLVLTYSLRLAYSPITVAFADFPAKTKPLVIGLSLIPLLVAVGVALYLLIARERIASWYVRDAELPLSFTALDLMQAGLVLLGVYLVAQAVPVLFALVISPISSWLQLRADVVYGEASFADLNLAQWFASNLPPFASSLASLGIGVYLIKKRDTIIGRLAHSRADADTDAKAASALCPSCGTAYDPADYEGGVAVPRCAACKEPLDIART